MEISTRNRLNKLIRQLEAGELEGDSDAAFMELLEPLLTADGFELRQDHLSQNPDVYHLASRLDGDSSSPRRIALDFRYYPRTGNISHASIESLLRARDLTGVDRLLILCNVPLAEGALQVAEENNPLGVEILSPSDLRDWVARQGLATNLDGLSVDGMLRALSRAFAMKIARDPNALRQLEWRDAERLLAEVFDGLGFDVELTPSAKDGGKDLILECVLASTRRSFIVEVKHWRAGDRVGATSVSEFLKVIVQEKRDAGVFLSTFGFTGTAFQALSQVDRQRIRFGARDKIVALCNTYLRADTGIWTSAQSLTEILFEGTTDGSDK